MRLKTAPYNNKPFALDYPSWLATQPEPLYSSEQVYQIEKAWFNQGYDSFALMQQAAWQISQYIIKHAQSARASNQTPFEVAFRQSSTLSATIWAGLGNNGGDGWLIAYYLSQFGWHVKVIDVGHIDVTDSSDAARARALATQQDIKVIDFDTLTEDSLALYCSWTHYHIDALFGIGLDRPPKDTFATAIKAFNQIVKQTGALAVSVDIPSGVVASTGQVFDRCAIQADITLCLVAAKLGLVIKDGVDYCGQVVHLPLIPLIGSQQVINPSAWQVSQPLPMLPRQSNSHKGSFGHVLIIGGNQSQGSQGMGGAAIMASGSALVSGAGKLTAACHHDFHGALLTAQPNAMVVNINEVDSVKSLIKAADVIAIGMGLGRDTHSAHLFSSYLDFAIKEQKSLVIDADGLYHLANLQQANAELILQLKSHSKSHQVCFTPHSGEAAKLLDMEVNQVEADRLSAIRRCAEIYGGQWLLKGAGSLVLIDDICFVCRVGNAGMATAGMGDVLAGLVAGLIAQSDISDNMESLLQGVLIHGKAGDISMTKGKGLRSLQAFDMLPAIAQVISELT